MASSTGVVGGNGNRRQTLRTNITQPYSVGFLHDRDHPEYNVSVFDELEKVSTATKHIFKGLDDVNKEINERTKALDALGLQVSEDFKKVWFEFNGVKMSIGNFRVENIYDLNGNSLSGILTGMQTEIKGNKGSISQVIGEIDSVNQYFLGEITNINSGIAGITQEIGIINKTGGTAMEALWGVKAHIGDITAGVGLVLKPGAVGDPKDPKNSEFYVKADQFNVYTDASNNIPVFSINGKTIDMNANVKIQSANIKDYIQSDVFHWDNDTGTPGQYSGWRINKNGYARFANDIEIVGTIQSANWNDPNATNKWRINKNGDASFNNGHFTGAIDATSGHIRGNVVIEGTISANHIVGDLYNAQTNAFHFINGKDLKGSPDHILLTIRGEDYDRILDSNMIISCSSGQRQYFTLREGGGLANGGGALTPVDIGYEWDTGNQGANGQGVWYVHGVTLRATGKGGWNTITMHIDEPNREAGISITTPMVFGAMVDTYHDSGSGYDTLKIKTRHTDGHNKDASAREKPTVRIYRKASNLIIGSMTP